MLCVRRFGWLPRNEENRLNPKTFVIETLIFDFGQYAVTNIQQENSPDNKQVTPRTAGFPHLHVPQSGPV